MQMEEECESTEDAITYMAGFDEQLTAFEAKTKVKDCIHMIKMINYSFKCIPFFFFFLTPPSTSSNHTRRVQNPWCYSSESVFGIQVWQLAQARGAHLQSVQMQ